MGPHTWTFRSEDNSWVTVYRWDAWLEVSPTNDERTKWLIEVRAYDRKWEEPEEEFEGTRQEAQRRAQEIGERRWN